MLPVTYNCIKNKHQCAVLLKSVATNSAAVDMLDVTDAVSSSEISVREITN